MARTAKVYLVGAGPGDPDLLTRKALRLLAQADAIIYDRLVSAEILALAHPEATFVYLGKRQGQQEEVQAEIFDWLLRLADHGIDAEIVPGISSAFAAPGLASISVTHRGVAAPFSVIAGHRQSLTSLDWSVYQGLDTLVILMGVEHRDVIAHTLIEQGRPADLHPRACVHHARREGVAA